MSLLGAAQESVAEYDAYLALVVGLLAAPVAAFITWLLSRPKQKADVHTSVVTSASAAVDTIADVLNEVRSELAEARQEIEALRSENQNLHQMVVDLRKQVAELHHLKYGTQ
jgi:cell shape-determining protein MreC